MYDNTLVLTILVSKTMSISGVVDDDVSCENYEKFRKSFTLSGLDWLARTSPLHDGPCFLLCKSRRTGRVFLHVITMDFSYKLSWWTGGLPDDVDLSIFNNPHSWPILYRLMGKPTMASDRWMSIGQAYQRAIGIVKSNAKIGFHPPR